MVSDPTKPGLRARVSSAILEAAAGILVARGDQASMQDVADAAGVARATLYRYFPTREALLEALSRIAVEDAGSRLEAARLDQVAVAEAFARAVRALVAVGDPLAVLVRQRGRPEVGDFDRRIGAPLRALVERGQAAGELRDDVPTGWLLESLLALVVSVLPSAPSLGTEDAVQAIAGLFLDGARGRRTGE
jgi:TetR/AcrR family transcriptional regulator, mexCD-oprJ operon repressor